MGKYYYTGTWGESGPWRDQPDDGNTYITGYDRFWSRDADKYEWSVWERRPDETSHRVDYFAGKVISPDGFHLCGCNQA